jgi:hypothetical protein
MNGWNLRAMQEDPETAMGCRDADCVTNHRARLLRQQSDGDPGVLAVR